MNNRKTALRKPHKWWSMGFISYVCFPLWNLVFNIIPNFQIISIDWKWKSLETLIGFGRAAWVITKDTEQWISESNMDEYKKDAYRTEEFDKTEVFDIRPCRGAWSNSIKCDILPFKFADVWDAAIILHWKGY